MKSSKIISLIKFVSIGALALVLIAQVQAYEEPAANEKQRAADEPPARQSGSGSVADNNNNNNPSFRRTLKNAMSVSVPIFYDMVRNGTSMGINVLSGLVKVERGEEAAKNGLQGTRPLSVRVFGVPVFERGQRVRPPSEDDGLFSSILGGLGGLGGFGGTTGGGANGGANGGNRGDGPKSGSGEPEVDIIDELPES